MIDFIMRVFGYENINSIKIPNEFIENPPNENLLSAGRIAYILDNKKIRNLITLKKDNILEYGYITYLIAKENNIKYVKVVRK